MASVPKDRWYFMVLCFFLPFLKVCVQQRGVPITVGLEEGMVLDCLCPWEGNLSMVTWTKTPSRIPIAVFHPRLGQTFSWRYRQRVEFPRAAPLDGSVVLRNVTHEDLGVYHCTVTTFPQGSWSRDVTVEDRDELPEEEQDDPASSTLTPAPVADIEVEARSGDNITVPCFHGNNDNDDGTTMTTTTTTTVRQVLVERYVQDRGHSNPWHAVASRWATEKEGDDEEVEAEEEAEEEGGARVNCMQSLVACHLWLESVTREDDGFYRCRVITDAGERTQTVRLTVRDPDEFSLSDYMIYIYTGSGAAGSLLLLSVFLVLLAYRKRNRRVEYTVKRRQGAALDTNIYENGHSLLDRQRDMPDNPLKTNRRVEYTVKRQTRQGAALETNIYENVHTLRYPQRDMPDNPMYGNVPRRAHAQSHRAAR